MVPALAITTSMGTMSLPGSVRNVERDDVGTFGSETQRLCAALTARRPRDERHFPSSRPVRLPSHKL